MAKKSTVRKPRARTRRKPKTQPNYDLIEARKAARQQHEILKLTKRARRDIAAHRRELRMLWWDLNRMFTGDFPAGGDEPAAEAPRAPNDGALADDEDPAAAVV